MKTRTNSKTPIPLKDVAMHLMRELNMPMSSILLFEQRDLVTLFDGVFNNRSYAFPSTSLWDKIKQIEEANYVKIYAVTRDYMPVIGYMYSFLCVSSHEEDWDQMVRHVGKDTYMAYAYVQNLQDNKCSEFGYVAVSVADFFLRRVG